MVVEIGERFNGINFEAGNQGRFGGVRFRDEHPSISIGTGSGSHRQNATRVTDDAIQREFADDERALDGRGRQRAGKHDDTQGDGQVIGRAFLADGSRG
jgi:hypothetical protein